MELKDKSVVITGGGNGIGLALAQRFARAGARGVAIADIRQDWAERAAEELRGAGVDAIGVACNVGDPDAVDDLVARADERFGGIDVFCSNAGYSDRAPGDLTQSVEQWIDIVNVNMLAHTWAARRVIPAMVERGGGYLLQTVSSAALITGPSTPGYTMTKHGALGFAEWVSLNYGHQGIRVSCLCPNAVHTGMFGRSPGDDAELPPLGSLGEMLTPEAVADLVHDAMTGDEPFLILPHPRVGESFLRKATDYDAWLERTRGRLERMRTAE